MNRILKYMLTVLCLSLMLCTGISASAPVTQATILFTHDLHSHFLPAQDENGVEYGGYARLKTAIDQQKAQMSDVLTCGPLRQF